MLTTSFPRYHGDYAGVFIYELATKLVEKGTGVEVVAPHAAGLPKRETMSGVKVNRFVYMLPTKLQKVAYEGGIPSRLKKNVGARIELPLFLLSYLIKSFRSCRSCDVIHAHWTVSAMIALLVSRLSAKKPVLLTVRGSDLRWIEHGWVKALTVPILRTVDKITAVDETLKSKVISLGIAADKVEMILNGVDTDRFRPMDAMTVRQVLGLPKYKTIVLFVGALIPGKGIKYLMQAIPKVVSQDEKVIFVFVGDGPLGSEAIKELTSRNLIEKAVFMGLRPSMEIPMWLNAADVLVLPSLFEGRPNVVLEAMACGTPVVATPVGGVPKLLQDGKTGLLVPVRDSEALSNGLLRVLQDEDLRGELTHRAREFIISEGLTWQHTAASFTELYQGMT
jgi:glycosyltransferase involved in cell wall biosynthesis